MSQPHPQPAGLNLKLGDVYHALFRHKWKILMIWAAGLIVGGVIWFARPEIYESRARLLIRYITDTRSIASGGDDTVMVPGVRGSTVMSSELAILSSYDLALRVAQAVGPSNILKKINGGSDISAAAGVVRSGIIPEAKGSVIGLAFQHPDISVVQPVLTEVISAYLRKHQEVYHAPGTLDEVLTRQTDQLRVELQQTEQQLRELESKSPVLTLEDSKRACADQISRIRENLFEAEAELKARQMHFADLTNMVPISVSTNIAVTASNSVAPEKLNEYKRLAALLDSLRKMEKDRLLQYLPESPRVLDIQKQIQEKERVMADLEDAYPQLLNTPDAAPQLNNDSQLVTQRDVWVQLAQIRQLQSKIEVLNEQMGKVRQEAAQIAESESDIAELRRKRDLLERHYKDFSTRLSNARLDDAFSSGRVSNISNVESPTPPSRAVTKVGKVAAGVAFGSLALAVALALVIELYIDGSIKRPIEIEQKLKIPLFLSIPHFRGARRKLLSFGGADQSVAKGNGVSPASFPWTQDPEMRTYYETLRDRLLLYFEAQNLTHKPKLVAITGCSPGSGVSTVASGLAATLSETGDGNVLLVDMNELENGAAAHFRRGKLECGLDDALEGNGKRESAMVQDNLYVVSENPNDRNLPRILHKRFQSLMPKLRASDYDYIIFDMPAVSQISPTSRLAKFMDMVFLVVEAEKTDRDVVKRAADMLTASKANVGVVLNKSRTYVPKALQQEL